MTVDPRAFALGLVLGFASWWVAYKLARPALLATLEREVRAEIPRQVPPELQAFAGAAGVDTFAAVAAGLVRRTADQALP